MMGNTLEKWRGAHPAIALFVFGVACAMTFGEVSAQVATFTTQRYPLLGNTHIAADLNGDGRPDLAGEALGYVKAPTLLIVGERDDEVLQLNERAYAQLQCEKSLAIVPHATHLFAEPGALEEVARLAADWFRKHLKGRK